MRLLVAVNEGGGLRYVGKIGAGFNQRVAGETSSNAWCPWPRRSLAVENPPTGKLRREAKWVRPELVIRAEFAGWTGDGNVRQASYKGIEVAKAPTDVVREVPRRTGPEVRPYGRVRGKRKRADSVSARAAGSVSSRPVRAAVFSALEVASRSMLRRGLFALLLGRDRRGFVVGDARLDPRMMRRGRAPVAGAGRPDSDVLRLVQAGRARVVTLPAGLAAPCRS